MGIKLEHRKRRVVHVVKQALAGFDDFGVVHPVPCGIAHDDDDAQRIKRILGLHASPHLVVADSVHRLHGELPVDDCPPGERALDEFFPELAHGLGHPEFAAVFPEEQFRLRAQNLLAARVSIKEAAFVAHAKNDVRRMIEYGAEAVSLGGGVWGLGLREKNHLIH